MYYIFRVKEDDNIQYGFLEEERVTEDIKRYAFRALDNLPEVTPELDEKEYVLDYVEETDSFK